MADETTAVDVQVLPDNLDDCLRPRTVGRMKGQIVMSDDFDDLPGDILDAIEAWDG